ncbi:fimbrial protein [Achromobacter marplatensis]|uniref:fimbrial protein n=1 Tax=Achromobacter marplatensis TaxID=470868 RepID=UPI0039F72F47
MQNTRIAVIAAALAVLGVFADQRPASAQSVRCTSLKTNAETLNTPRTITIPRNIRAGIITLTPWVKSQPTGNLAQCTFSGAAQDYGGGYGFGTDAVNSGYVYAETDNTYPIYKTSVPGIGFVARVDVQSGQCPLSSYPVRGPQSLAGALCNPGTLPLPTPFYVRATAAIRFVKYLNTAPAGGVISAQALMKGRIATRSGPMGTHIEYGNFDNYISIPNIEITVGTCSTSDQDIALGDHTQSSFVRAGYTTKPTYFSLKLDNCSAGMSRIRYRLDATTTIINPAQGVVALDATSAAKGLGVQLLDGKGDPYKFGQWTTVGEYTGQAGSFSIPFRARYYQTASTVSPGPAGVSMILMMSYE